jgi:two-component system sensor histidine kinase SenX3
VKQIGEFVELTVSDEGPGIAEDFASQLFEQFSQASRGDRRVSRGIGLGLVIVRDLAQAMGGDASYAPNSPRGACFTVRLPAA